MSELNHLIRWIKTFDVSAAYDDVDQFFDGFGLAYVLNSIDSNHFDDEWLSTIAEVDNLVDNRDQRSNLALGNFRSIIDGIEQFFYNNGKRMAPKFEYDAAAIAVDRDIDQLTNLIKLIVGCATISDRMIDLVEKMQTLDIESQLTLKRAIEDLHVTSTSTNHRSPPSTSSSSNNSSKSTPTTNRIKNNNINCEYKRQLELLEIEFEQVEHDNQQLKYKMAALSATNEQLLNDLIRCESQSQAFDSLSDEIQKLKRENFQLRSLAVESNKLRDQLDESTLVDDWSTMSNSVVVESLQTKSKQLIEMKNQFKSIDLERNQLQTELTSIRNKLSMKDQTIKMLKEKLTDVNQELMNQSCSNQSNQQELDLLKTTLVDLNDDNNQLRRQLKLIRCELNESRRCSQLTTIDCDQVNYDTISVNSETDCQTLTPDVDLDQLEDQIRSKTKMALVRSGGQQSTSSGSSLNPSERLISRSDVDRGRVQPRPLSELLADIHESASMRLKSIRSNSTTEVVSESEASYKSTVSHQVVNDLSTTADVTDEDDNNQSEVIKQINISNNSSFNSFFEAPPNDELKKQVKQMKLDLDQKSQSNQQLAQKALQMKKELKLSRAQIASLKVESQRVAILDLELTKLRRKFNVVGDVVVDEQESTGSGQLTTVNKRGSRLVDYLPSLPKRLSVVDMLTSSTRAPPKPKRTFEGGDDVFEFVEHSDCNMTAETVTSSTSTMTTRRHARRFDNSSPVAQMLIDNLEHQNAINMKRINVLQARLRDHELNQRRPEVDHELNRLRAQLTEKTETVATLETKLEIYERQWKW